MNDWSRRRMLTGALAAGGASVLPGAVAHAAESGVLRLPARLFEMTLVEARTRRPLQLLRDAIGSRVVALNFMFTGCSSVCPMQSIVLSRTQRLMAGKMGREVGFLSISLSPISDTPEKLTAYANAHAAGPGWLFLAGDFVETNRLQTAFEAFEPDRTNHPPVIFIGRSNAARWTRLYGLPKPEQVASALNAWL